MSTTEVTCPNCSARLVLPPGTTATRFRCTQCATVFDSAAPAPPAAVAAPEPAPAPPPPPPAPVPEPVAGSAFDFPMDSDEPEPEPAPRGRRRRDEDADERPVRRPAKGGGGGGKGMKIALIAGAAVLGLTAVAVGGYFAFREPAKPVAKAETPPTTPLKAGPKAAPPPLTPEQAIKKVQASTVYVRNTMREGIASGSGFFAGKAGFIVTNAHVVGYGPDAVKAPTKLEVIVDFGETTERTFPATIYGLNAEQDLALLKVDAIGLPPPLLLGKAEDLTPTQPVIAFGYPLGTAIGKNMTITSTTVSSLKKENGHIVRVQMNGGITHGNSGGPVANVKGEVVGVSVSGIKSTAAIVFAIPAETTTRFIEDQFAGPTGKMELGSLSSLSLDELDGQYLMTGLERMGVKQTEDELKKLGNADRTVVIRSGRFFTFSKGRPVEASLSVDPAKKPAHIDIVSSKGDTTETSYGIYRLENGVLTICLAKGEEKDRPTEFAAGDTVTLMTLRKVVPK